MERNKMAPTLDLLALSPAALFEQSKNRKSIQTVCMIAFL